MYNNIILKKRKGKRTNNVLMFVVAFISNPPFFTGINHRLR